MLAKDLLDVIVSNNVSTARAKQIKLHPMGCNDIKKYLPKTRIVLNGDIAKFKNITHLLPEPIDTVILLFRSSSNKGHWVLLSRYDDIIEYFDPYGYEISHPINWIDEHQQQELNEYDHLTRLLTNSPFNILVNKYQFQDRKNLSIATCGRWCVIRALTILNKKLSLDKFTEVFKTLKQKTGLSLDIIVSDLIHHI